MAKENESQEQELVRAANEVRRNVLVDEIKRLIQVAESEQKRDIAAWLEEQLKKLEDRAIT